MANRNGLGPNNEGPMTGRGFGNCNSESKDRPDDIGGFLGRGFGGGSSRRGSRGRGLGAGQGRGIGRRGGRRQFFRQTSADSNSMDRE